MQRFIVRFLKTIPNSSGHCQSCVQHSITVDAESSAIALAEAQHAFCSMMHVSECRFYADAFEVECLQPNGPVKVGALAAE